jgi:hypothetical protein
VGLSRSTAYRGSGEAASLRRRAHWTAATPATPNAIGLELALEETDQLIAEDDAAAVCQEHDDPPRAVSLQRRPDDEETWADSSRSR